MPSGTIYAKSGRVVARRIAGESLLVPIRGNLADLQRLFLLEGASEFIWEQIDGKRDLEAIREALVAEFDVGPEQAREDVARFVEELRQAELVEEA